MSVGQGMSKYAKEYFTEQSRKHTIWAECPSIFAKKPEYPAALSKQTLKFYAGGKVDGEFKDDPHTAWESYQKTMSTD